MEAKKAKEKVTILVIDDEPSVTDALQIILEANGFAVVTASNGYDGLEQVRQQQFDFTITDLHLPDISGLKVLTAIREKNSQSPVIIITAHNTSELRAEAITLGAVDVLSKPFSPSDILGLITRALKTKEAEHS